MVEEEYFWGVQLDSKTKEIEWNPEKNFPKEEKEEGIPVPRHSLMIKQAILSHEASDGEVAVVEAEAMGYAQANIKTLIAVMVQGKDHQRSLDLVFHDAPVKLRLVKGSGPVHLVGAHGVAYRYVGDDDDDDDEDGMEGEEDVDEEDLEEEEDTKPPAKRKKGDDVKAKVEASPNTAKRGGKK